MKLEKSVEIEIEVQPDPKVVVIGDDEISSKELALLLEEAGIETTMARNANIRKIDDALPNAVIVEEKAGKGGWEVSSQIRQKSNVPIIVLGDSNSEIAWAKAAAYGVDCYLHKPFGSRELVARIKSLVRRYDDTSDGFTGLTRRGLPARV